MRLETLQQSQVFDTGDVTEDSFYGMQWLLTQGKLTISDPDSGEAQFDPVIHAHNYAGIGYDTKLGGHILLSRDGSWDYQMDNFSPEVQKLAAGETAVDTVTVHSVDGTLHDIQITIHGTNDAPVLSVTQTTPTTGTLTETDVDVKDTHTFSVVNSTGQFGSLSVDPDSGAYVYTANGSVAGMSYNATTHTYHGTDVFEVKVADNHGGESSEIHHFRCQRSCFSCTRTIADDFNLCAFQSTGNDNATKFTSRNKHSAK